MKRLGKISFSYDVMDPPPADAIASIKQYALDWSDKMEMVDEDPSPAKTIARMPHGMPIPNAVMRHFFPNGTFLQRKALDWAREHQPKIKDNSITPALSILVKGGYVERVEQGKFRFVKPMPGVQPLGQV
jgi:hypothetical protein